VYSQLSAAAAFLEVLDHKPVAVLLGATGIGMARY
jgi:hypothetical protein